VSAGRRLVIVQRRVPLDESGTYDARWSAYRDAARAAGAKAWRFRSLSEPARFVEFLEFAEGSDPRGRPELISGSEALERLGAAETEEWSDANVP